MGNLIKTMDRKIIKDNFKVRNLRSKDLNKTIKYKKLSKIRSNFINPKKSIFKFIKNSFILYYITVSILNFSFLFIESKRRNILLKFSEIRLKLKMISEYEEDYEYHFNEDAYILSDSFFKIYNQCDIYINESKKDVIKNKYPFVYSKNDIYFIRIVWNISIYTASYMFDFCEKMIEIDLSNFDSSLLKDTSYMFRFCETLTSIKFTNFDTSLVTDMNSMFWECYKLEFLDLSSFNTSLVTKMNNMFFQCSTLNSLNISSFDTSSVINMGNMFNYCESLNSLDLSSFNTSNVKDMISMFLRCFH